MDVVAYLLALFISFLGLFIGIILSNITLEELSYTTIYLKYLNILLLPLIIFVATYSIFLTYSIIISLIVFLVLIVYRERYNSNNKIIYCCLGALFYIAHTYDVLFLTSVLIFVYGIFVGTIISYEYFRNHKIKSPDKITLKDNTNIAKYSLMNYAYYVIVAMVFFVMFELII